MPPLAQGLAIENHSPLRVHHKRPPRQCPYLLHRPERQRRSERDEQPRHQRSLAREPLLSFRVKYRRPLDERCGAGQQVPVQWERMER